MANVKRKVGKLWKRFEEQIEQCRILDMNGNQILQSFENVGERLPLISQQGEGNCMGILGYDPELQVKLIQKHIIKMENLRLHLNQNVEDYQEVVQEMQRITSSAIHYCLEECLDARSVVDSGAKSVSVAEYLERMQNLVSMYNREVDRKERIVAELQYSDIQGLKDTLWLSSSRDGQVDPQYVDLVTMKIPSVSPNKKKNKR